jgi:hypothetical protein
MRKKMIFDKIKVVKSWEIDKLIEMGKEKRNEIRKDMNEDEEKLLKEGEKDDNKIRRLSREMEEVKRIFDEFEKRARAEEESKNEKSNLNEKIK